MFDQTQFLLSAHGSRDFPPDTGAEVAFAGRSNSGKSSTLNVITGRKGLARTSKTPGRTQLINFFNLSESRRLVDLPGYGFAKVPVKVKAHWQALVESYFLNRRSLRGLLLVTDARRPLSEFDRQMIEWVTSCGCPMHILVNKADKLKRAEARDTLARVRADLGPDITAQLFSALKRTGLEEAREAVLAMFEAAASS